jgi:hypothetical protein
MTIEINEDWKAALVQERYVRKQNTIKKQILDMQDKASDDAKAEQDKLDAENRENEKNADRMTTDERGNKLSYWALVKQKADQFVRPAGQQSYIEWSTAIMELLAAYSDLNKAIFYDESYIKFVWNNTIGETKPGQLVELAASKAGEVLGSIPTKLHRGVRRAALGIDRELPDLTYKIDIDETGKLNTTATVDGEPMPPEVKVGFDTLMAAWLESEHGVHLNPDTHQLTKGVPAPGGRGGLTAGAALTPDELRAITLDNEKGYKCFSYKKEELELSPESVVSVSPRP